MYQVTIQSTKWASHLGGNEFKICISCGLNDKSVDCKGIHYCPNPICIVCGAACHKKSLKSHREISSGSFTVDAFEVIGWAAKLFEVEEDPNMMAAMVRSLQYWYLKINTSFIKEIIDS